MLRPFKTNFMNTRIEILMKDWIMGTDQIQDIKEIQKLRERTIDFLSTSSMLQCSLILKRTSEKTGISINEIKGTSRKGPIVKARKIFIRNVDHFINKCTDEYYNVRIISLKKMGEMIGKDHASIIHMLREAKNDIETYKEHDLYDLGL